jgi:cell division protein FtsZ
MAEIARSQGGIVIGMVTTPFHVERSRILAAEGGLQALRPHVDTLIVIDNNRLMEIAPHLPLEQAFSVVDQLIAEIIKGITETITLPSLINLDYADVKTIMSCKGISYMVIGEGQIKDPMRVVRSAFCNPLMDVDPRGATGCLLHITGGPEMTLKDASMIASEMTSELDPSANVIWGARIRSDFGSRVRVMAIITGASSPEPFSKKADRCGDRQAEVAREIGGLRAAEARWT